MTKSPGALVWIDFANDVNEPDPLTYQGVMVNYLSGPREITVQGYSTGDPVADWAEAHRDLPELAETWTYGSSVDDFVNCGGVLEPEDEPVIEVTPERPLDQGFEAILSSVHALADAGLLQVRCNCEDCLFDLASDLHDKFTGYRPVLAA
jgi:hypothetical protein